MDHSPWDGDESMNAESDHIERLINRYPILRDALIEIREGRYPVASEIAATALIEAFKK